MLEGLQLMGAAELGELAKLTRLDEKKRESMNEDELRRHILQWAGKSVGASSSDPAAIEHACLNWVAQHWNIALEDDVDELERALRIRIADDASQYLAPVWWVAVALIAAGPADAIGPKIRLLEKAASLVVPSRSARQKLANQWREKAESWGFRGLEQPEIKQALEQLRKAPEKADQALILALVISLADGRLAMEEERLFRAMGDEVGFSSTQLSELIRKVNERYWGHQIEVAPKRAVDDSETEKLTAMQAAQKTLDSAGTLEGLCLEACDKAVHLGEAQDHAPKSGWQRVLGTVSGLKGFFSNRMRSDNQVNLVRLVYLSIIHQHAEAANKAEAAAAKARQAAAAAAVAPAPTPDPGTKVASRVIKLD